MRIKPDCVVCMLKMALGFMRVTGLPEEQIQEQFRTFLDLPATAGKNWTATSPEVIEVVMNAVYRGLRNDDPLAAQKDTLNRRLLARYADFEAQVQRSPDPLFSAVNLAIAGNAIDIMLSHDLAALESTLLQTSRKPVSLAAYTQFKRQLGRSRRLLYFGDNAGEIVLDKLLIATLTTVYDCEIVYVVRSQPTLNDVTPAQAVAVGLDELVPVVANGIAGPFPGTDLPRCADEVQDLYQRADLVIAKGGGNFDTLEEAYKLKPRKISFLLLSRCGPYVRHFGVPQGEPILSNDYG